MALLYWAKFKKTRIDNRKKIIENLKKNPKWSNQFSFIKVPKKMSPSKETYWQPVRQSDDKKQYLRQF